MRDAIQAEGLVKRFGGTTALAGADLVARTGTVLAVLGPHGAGKTTGLDPRGRSDLWRVVRRLVDDGVTVLLTTQYMEEADQLADDIVVIDRGQVVATGTPDQLKSKVGRQVLQVSPVDETDLGTVAAVVGELAREAPEVAHGGVSIAVNDPGLPPAILQRLTAAGVQG